jgi:hypothetical protein
MGEQPVPAKNEVERALASMSAGFHSGSDQIAAGIASLEAHLATAPLDEQQERVRATIVQIAATQARLKGQVERLPQPSWDRFKAMVGVLKAQQTVLDEVGLLVKEHVLPRQMQNLSVTALPPGPQPQPEPPPPAPMSLPARPRVVSRRPPPRRRPAPVDDDDEPRSVFSRIRIGPAFRGLVAMAVAGLAITLMPRDIKLVDLGTKIIDLVGGEVRPVPAEVPSQTAATPPPAPAVKRFEERAPSAPEVEVAADTPALAPKQERPAAPQVVAAATDRQDPPAIVKPGDKRVAAPAAAKEATPPPAAPREEQFVPVVFTHQDHDTVMRALADLKQQYPSVLIGRKGEVLPVDLGKKGVWHRLVMLPAGPRPQATKLCDQLAAQGYDRCWVKAY